MNVQTTDDVTNVVTMTNAFLANLGDLIFKMF